MQEFGTLLMNLGAMMIDLGFILFILVVCLYLFFEGIDKG